MSVLAHARTRWRVTARRDRIRRLGRDRLGAHSDADLARHLNLSTSAMCHMLGGKSQPTAPVIAQLIDALGAPFEDLFAVELIQRPAGSRTDSD